MLESSRSSKMSASVHWLRERTRESFIPELYSRLERLLLGLVSAVRFLLIGLPGLDASFSRRKQREALVDSEKLEFLDEFGDHYGYPNGPVSVDQLRASEFPQLNGTVYLDHAGATLHSKSQLQEFLADCSSQVYGNPHSQSESSLRTSEAIENARKQVLAYFHASPSEYACVFTSGATAALKLVGEAFPWTSDSHFYYTKENHNSVLGIREYALAAGATTTSLSCDNEPFVKAPGQRRECFQAQATNGDVYNLLAVPTECNFSGVKSDIQLVDRIKNSSFVTDLSGRWLVLLDAAKSSGTSPPDLSRCAADFVVLSFYKIFGYPTGLGALIVRRDAANLLNNRYFGGGTVAVSVADIDYVKRRESIEQRLEDGTVAFLSIRALHFGLEAINKLGVTAIARHTWALTHYTASVLRRLKHANGTSVCCIYGNHGLFKTFAEEFRIQGPVLTFNLKRSDGTWVGYREVEKVASLCQIHLRTGCFCNPGACAKYLGLSNEDLRSNFEAGHVCWDDRDIISGKPTGAVRVSFGYMTTFEDCQMFLRFIREYFVEDINRHQVARRHSPSTLSKAVHLKSIVVYPIKSCAGFSVDSWPVVNSGLLYDREFVLCDAQNTVLTQKKVPSMCLLSTYVDLKSHKLIVRSRKVGHALEISLKEMHHQTSTDVLLCGERAKSNAYGGTSVSQWFSEALGTECILIRKNFESITACKWRTPEHSSLEPSRGGNLSSFANEGQFLLLSESSLQDLCTRSNALSSEKFDALQFRPNLVVAGAAAYEEDNWEMLRFGSLQLPVIGGCNRCKMITIDQKTGKTHSSGEPLLTLASYRRSKGKILFGLLLGAPTMKAESYVLEVGSSIELG